MRKKIIQHYKTKPFNIRLYIVIRMMLVDVNKVLKSFPKQSTRTMDLACGFGIASFMLAQKYEGAQIDGYEINQTRVEILKKINPYQGLTFHYKSVLDIETFDAQTIFMSDLLHHLTFSQQKQLLKKIHDTAPEGMVLIVKDMDKGKLSFRQFCNYMIDIVHTKEVKFFYHTKDSFVNLFTSLGFKVKKVEYVNKWFIPLNHVFFVLERS